MDPGAAQPLSQPPGPGNTFDAVVVGGGLSGLSLGFELRELGLSIRVLETAPRAGGVIHTERHGGYLTECGAHGFLDKEPVTRSLIARLGLEPKLQSATEHRRYLFTRGALRAAPTSPPGLLASDLLPVGARLRLLAELVVPRRNEGRNRSGDESLAGFARRRLGPRATAVLVDAMQSGIYAGDPERLSLPACFPLLAELERKHRSLLLGLFRERPRRARPPAPMTSFQEGMEQLPRALGVALGESLECDRPVRAISRTNGLWAVQVGSQALYGRAVILALPAHAAALLVRGLRPTLADELESIPYAPLAVVHLGFRGAALGQAPRGFGFLVPFEEGLQTLGSFFVDQLLPNRAEPGNALFTCMVGGARRPGLVIDPADGEADRRLAEVAEAELRRVLKLGTPASFTHVVRWPRAIPQYELGHLGKLERIDSELTSLPRLFLTGNAYRGVGVNDCIRSSAQLAVQVVQTLRS